MSPELVAGVQLLKLRADRIGALATDWSLARARLRTREHDAIPPYFADLPQSDYEKRGVLGNPLVGETTKRERMGDVVK